MKPDREQGLQPYVPKDLVADQQRLRDRGIFVGDTVDQDSQLAVSAYKQLRTHVLAELDSLGARTLMVTGPTAGVGKTTVSLNLAINASRLPNMKVVLIDFDLRGSSMLEILGSTQSYGTERIADRDFSIVRARVSLGGGGPLILPCAERTIDSSERLMSPAANALVARLQRLPKGFLVIYDTPPVLGCDDVAALLPNMDAAVMVVEEGRTSRRELNEAIERIDAIPVISTVLNKSRDRNIRKYYY